MEYNLTIGIAFVISSILTAIMVGIPMWRLAKVRRHYLFPVCFFASMAVLNIMNGLLMWVHYD